MKWLFCAHVFVCVGGLEIMSANNKKRKTIRLVIIADSLFTLPTECNEKGLTEMCIFLRVAVWHCLFKCSLLCYIRKVMSNSDVCRTCDSSLKKDLSHFLFACKAYFVARDYLVANIHQLEPADFPVHWLVCQWMTVIKYLWVHVQVTISMVFQLMTSPASVNSIFDTPGISVHCLFICHSKISDNMF